MAPSAARNPQRPPLSSTSLRARSRATTPSDAAFSGWRIVAIAAAALAMTAPGQTVGVSVFVDPLMDGLGLTRSQVSGAYLVGTLTAALTLPLVGRWIDRYGVRLTTAVIAGLFGAVLVAMSGVVGLITLVLGFTGIRMLGQGSLSLASSTAVTLWFSRRRGMALGITSAVGAAVMSLIPLALAAGIERFEWRITWSLAGLAVWIIVVPLAWFGLRDRPADLGQHVDGVRPADAAQAAADVAAHGWTRAEAVRTLMFWAVSAAVATSGLIGTALGFHQISLLGERGLTVTQAAANFLPQTAAAIGGTLAMGALVDRLPPRLLVAASMASIASALVLAQVARPGWSAIAFGVAVGLGGGSIRTLEAAAFPRYFGVAHVGAIRGLVMSLSVGGTAFGPLLLAVGFERFGSYGPALTMLLVLPVVVAIVAVFAPVPDAALRDRVRAKLEAT
jgi:MFS family permease